MNEFLDEDTVAIEQSAKVTKKSLDDIGAFLETANTLKNHAKYTADLQKYNFFENPIMSACSEVLSLTVSIGRMSCPNDLFLFRNGLKRAITDLKYKVSLLDYPASVPDKTCFLFCIMLDEQILHSEWGEESGWENQTLVSELFGIKNGGEQFYAVTERALSQPVLLADLIELIYVLLKMGFQGQFRGTNSHQIDMLVQRLETTIFSKHLMTEPKNGYGINMSPDISHLKLTRPKRPVKYWQQFSIFGLLIVIVLGAVSYWYDTTLPQRARDFYALEKFTDTYYSAKNSQATEYTYTSTVEEMEAAISLYGRPNNINEND
ncbi:type IVB secretion system protein IcmH/DotU [Marinomonas sp. 15G1-11]|uniref:Type IVB secretion system protein IcmH/DotU n=1 Tax=Marinomonas phaeophyticola TaxID=3004091 RepID=A0ABT4JTE1_9GAMM|nr:type IVB secretion system protein IcmH/DotU [Marinomonas sp. 15G1-11]MCZ2720869.1 type IVB secretion system protein IcmH/DotU [Marinomonas sp. 15G1-11]